MGHADALSRCPLPDLVSDPAPELPLLALHHLDSGPVNAARVAAATSRDLLLKPVCDWVLRGWPPGKLEEKFLSFGIKREELSVLHGVLMWGDRVVIPQVLQAEVLQTLHAGHPGVVKMKALARSFVWWPGLDSAIQGFVAACSPCQAHRNNPPKLPPAKWEKPAGPWSRLHIDFAGPFQGCMLFVLVDAFSKWVEVVKMGTTTTEAVIPVLTHLFATHGLPDIIVSDNGPQFTSVQMENFLGDLGIWHILTAPYHPQCNGLAEKFVHVTKLALQRLTKGSWQERIDSYLSWQHATPNTTTGVSPAELLMGRRLRTVLDRLHPKYSVESDPKLNGDPSKLLSPDENVHAKSYRDGETWVPAKVIRQTSPRSYEVQLEDGRVWKRHSDQLRAQKQVLREPSSNPDILFLPSAPTVLPGTLEGPESTKVLKDSAASDSEADCIPPGLLVSAETETSRSLVSPTVDPIVNKPVTVIDTPVPDKTVPPSPSLRRSTRLKTKPPYLKDYIC